ncbi:hypothetical protein C2E23DRAFT_810121 [Lenzites betulinus]|nr:hypothetical protein C2E23DRAFT_810121 [Lenzites betulinus]
MSRASGTRAAKRRRGDQDAAMDTSRTASTVPGGFQFERDTEFWLDDGSLILIAQTTGFRVYRGLLASQSEVFRDMFDSANPSTGDRFEDCPVVHLSDSPQDLRHLLRVIVPTSQDRFSISRQGCKSFDELYAIARLANKYSIPGLEEQTSVTLKRIYVKTYRQYVATMRETPNMRRLDDACAIGAIHCARLLNQPNILPHAMYTCCRLGGSILDGWKREDGIVEHLSTEDLKRVIDGREKLACEARRVFGQVFEPVPGGLCDDYGGCERVVTSCLEDALARSVLSDAAAYDVFGPIANPNGLEYDALCDPCAGLFDIRHHMQMENIWMRLPEIFGLNIPGWGKADSQESISVFGAH